MRKNGRQNKGAGKKRVRKQTTIVCGEEIDEVNERKS